MESFDTPIVLIIIALLSFIGTLVLIMIAVGSVYMLVHNWNRNATNERLTSLETGLKEVKSNQTKFEIELKEIKENQVKLERDFARLDSWTDEQSKLTDQILKIVELLEKRNKK